MADGDKAYLIRDNDKLDCLFARGDDGIIVSIPIPDSKTLEEIISRLLEMRPVLINDNTIDFIENKVEELHTWDVKYGSPITLIRIGENLKCKTVLDDEQIQKNILTPDGLSSEKKIEWIMKRHPHIYVIDGEYVVKFEEKVKKETSVVDGKTPLDMDHWCVTMLNSGNSKVCSSGTWMGHSLLVVETIEEGGYFSRQADLVLENKEANVRFFELDRNKTKEKSKSYSKSETYSRPKEDIQRMLDHIWLKVCDQKEGKPSVFFKTDGDARPFWERFYARKDLEDRPLFEEIFLATRDSSFESSLLVRFYTRKDLFYARKDLTKLKKEEDVANCTKFSIETMEVANIKPPLSSGCVLSNEVFKTPPLYVGSVGSKVKAVMQEALMITAQTGLYSGVCSYAAWSILSCSTGAFTVGPIAAFIVGGPIAAGSVWAGSFIGATLLSTKIAASIGAVGGGIASLSQVAKKYAEKNSQNVLNIEPLSLSSVNEKTIKPSILKEDK